ncbi:hypothetical protein D3C87_890520 [compost metagenome]
MGGDRPECADDRQGPVGPAVVPPAAPALVLAQAEKPKGALAKFGFEGLGGDPAQGFEEVGGRFGVSGIRAFDPELADFVSLRQVLYQPVAEAAVGMGVVADEGKRLGQHGVAFRPVEDVEQPGGGSEVVDVRGNGGIQVEVAPAGAVCEAGDGIGFLHSHPPSRLAQPRAGENGGDDGDREDRAHEERGAAEAGLDVPGVLEPALRGPQQEVEGLGLA